ncbi:MAG TPA: LLM class flavin-dependent oxidoreductase [Actinomycetota bacterium]|nr:LLM class flavin-dependent oxidoreductase [Actinomycetota bacterium]
MTVRIGLGLFTGQVPQGSDRTFEREYRETLELVRLAETVGFDSAWVSEHHGASDGYLPSLLPMLAAFAAVTERIALGTGVVLTPFHDPLRLAEDCAVVDQLSGGRLILGLGSGWREEEFRAFGVPKAERVQRTVETVEILRRAWTGRRFSFEGRSFRYDRVRVTPPAVRHGGPRIYLGGYAERAVRRAGRLGDGYITDDAGVDEVGAALAIAEAGAREAGRDPRGLGLALLQNAFVAAEGDAWGTVRSGVLHQIGAYAAWDANHDTPEHDSLEPAVANEDELRRWTPVGTPDEVARALRPSVDAYGDRPEFHLVVRLHYPGMALETAAGAVELFAREVIPALRDA